MRPRHMLGWDFLAKNDQGVMCPCEERARRLQVVNSLSCCSLQNARLVPVG
jgi:hypothetical protein